LTILDGRGRARVTQATFEEEAPLPLK